MLVVVWFISSKVKRVVPTQLPPSSSVSLAALVPFESVGRAGSSADGVFDLLVHKHSVGKQESQTDVNYNRKKHEQSFNIAGETS